MKKADAQEAQPIVNITLDALLSWTATRGRTGADLRAACGDVKANALTMLQNNSIAGPLINCFDKAQLAGINLPQIEHVRRVAAAQTPVTVGAIITKDTLIELALATAGQIIATMEFVSREDVDRVRALTNIAFEDMEEELADQMDSMTWRVIISLHAAISMHLYETARPLPRLLSFRFGTPLPTLVMAHRLYADAGRADELRAENKVVHPAFMRQYGRALSN